MTALRQGRALEMSRDGWLVASEGSRLIIEANRIFLEVLQRTPDQVIGQDLVRVLDGPDGTEAGTMWEEIERTGKASISRLRMVLGDGQQRYLNILARSYDESGQRVIHFHVRDVSECKREEEEVLRVRDEAASASAAKDRFLASLSHELRTPLNPALLLASENAANERLPLDVRHDFDAIRKHIELEVHLIDDILDLTRIAQGKLALAFSSVDLHAVVREALTIIRAEVREKKLTLAVQLSAERFSVSGDAVRLQQVFWNLLRNSVKFTPAGGRIVIASRVTSDGAMLEADISDTGIGLTAQEIALIFDEFAQGRHAQGGTASRFGGLGLGLTISRVLVELHGGSITASSAGKDQGATFTVRLPLDRVGTPSAPTTPAAPLPSGPKSYAARPSVPKRTRILLVEDHHASRVALAAMLERRGYEVIQAESVGDALRSAAAHSCDLLVSDIGLPDGDGYALMSDLRVRYRMSGIALTGYGMEDDRARSAAAGYFVHLTKPVSIKSLEAALTKFHQASPDTGAPSPTVAD